jgi:hypothetical protein
MSLDEHELMPFVAMMRRVVARLRLELELEKGAALLLVPRKASELFGPRARVEAEQEGSIGVLDGTEVNV